jgi:hypothetical protein
MLVSVNAAAGPMGVIVNEVLYDPPGKDAGLEFIELYNVSDAAACLGGWKLETGNGAYENHWTIEWSGAQTDTIGARCFFVVGEELVSPRPGLVTDLDLQNGPDACRLISPDGLSDVIGWGEHTYPEYYEGMPVTCPASGLSIGRDPDGRDTDQNAQNFACLSQPSPGDFNHPPCDLAITKAGLSRYASSSGAEIDLVCNVSNLGTQGCGEGGEISAAVGTASGTCAITEEISPGASVKLVVRLPNPGEGLHPTRIWLLCEPDRRHWNDTLFATVVLPPPPIVINEIMFKPVGKDCEWIEVFNRSPASLSIKDWTLEDTSRRPRKITDQDVLVTPGGFVVLVENEDAFLTAYGDSEGLVSLKPLGGWPTLNDVDGPLGFADAIVIRDVFGTAVDSVAYGERWSRPGYSVERIDTGQPSTDPANWSPHYGGPGGSPGKQNSVSFFLPQGQTILTLSPSTFSPDDDGRDDLLAVSVRLPIGGTVRLTVFDVNGRLVRRLIDGEGIEAARVTFWDGRDDDGARAPVGVYIVAVEASLVGRDKIITAKSPAVLIRR